MAEDTNYETENTEADSFYDEGGAELDRVDRKRRRAAFKANLRKGGRGFLVIIAVVAAYGAYAYFTSGGETETQNNSATVTNRGGQGNVEENELSEDSPIAQRQQEARVQQREQARQQGDTYIEGIVLQNDERQEEKAAEESVDTKPDTGDLVMENFERQTKRVESPVTPPGQTRQSRAASEKSPKGWTLQDEIDEAQGYSDQVVKDLRRVAEAQANYGTYEGYQSVQVDETSGSSNGGGDDGDFGSDVPFVSGGFGESLSFDQNPSGESPRTFRVPPDTRLLAVTTVGHNSDVGGPLSFESVTPPLDGAVFLAEEAPVQGEKVAPRITRMIYRGETYSVQALAVNAETFEPGLASDVDNHYLSRWVPYLLGTFGGAYAETLRGSTTTTSPEGATVNETGSIPSADDQLKFTVGTGLGRMVPILQQQIDRPVTVSVYNGEQVGIWILSELEVKR